MRSHGPRRVRSVAPVRPVATPPRYGRRRLVAGIVASIALVVGVGALEAAWSSAGGASSVGATPSGVATQAGVHVASPGDTLWSIADTYRGEVDRSAYVTALVRLNGGAGIQVGQAVQLP